MDGPLAVAKVREIIQWQTLGADAEPEEIHKISGPVFIKKLSELFQCFGKQGSIP